MDQLEDPDVEDLLVTWLASALAADGFTVPVSDRKIATECVVVYRVGGPDRDTITGLPLVKFDVHAVRNSRASAICRRVVALVMDLPGTALAGSMVYAVDTFQGASSDPNPPGDPVRYTATLQLAVRKSLVA